MVFITLGTEIFFDNYGINRLSEQKFTFFRIQKIYLAGTANDYHVRWEKV